MTFVTDSTMLELELAQLLEGTTDAAFAVDLQGDVRTWNKAAEKLFGYPASHAIGKPCAELVGGIVETGAPVCRQSCDVLECVRNGREISNYDMRIRTRTERSVWVNVSLLVASIGRTERRLAVHLLRDIRERKQAEHRTSKLLRIARDIVSGTGEVHAFPPISPLTKQEQAILAHFASGKTTAEVTAELGISSPTLRNHLYRVNQKLHTKSRIEAVIQALKRGLI